MMKTHVNAHTMYAQCHLPLYLCVEEIQITLVECGGIHSLRVHGKGLLHRSSWSMAVT